MMSVLHLSLIGVLIRRSEYAASTPRSFSHNSDDMLRWSRASPARGAASRRVLAIVSPFRKAGLPF